MLSIQDLCQTWSPNLPWTLEGINLTVKPGELVTLLGPSGCGKTTLLRCLAGFVQPQKGDILYNQKSLLSVPVEKRPFHMVFQKPALFPHLSVFDNVAFALRLKKWSENKVGARVSELLNLMNISELKSQKPAQLSGGQGQRVALARALADGTEFLLLDEPFSALDEKQKNRLQAELKKWQRDLGMTLILVTHDQSEALSLSDRVVLMNRSHVEQIGTPQELYSQPKTLFAAEFIGRKNRVAETPVHFQYLRSEDLSLTATQDSDLKFDLRIEFILDQGRQIEVQALYNFHQPWVLHFSRAEFPALQAQQPLRVYASSQNLIQVKK